MQDVSEPLGRILLSGGSREDQITNNQFATMSQQGPLNNYVKNSVKSQIDVKIYLS